MARFPSNVTIDSLAMLPADLYVEGIHLGKVGRPTFLYHREMAPVYTLGNTMPIQHQRTITIRFEFLGDPQEGAGYAALFSGQPVKLIFDCPIDDRLLRTYECLQTVFDKEMNGVFFFESTHLHMSDIPRKNKGALKLLKVR